MNIRRMKWTKRVVKARPCKVHMCYLSDLLVFDLDNLTIISMRITRVTTAISGYTLRFIIK